MNKRWSKNIKGAANRLLALLLCVSCLCGLTFLAGADTTKVSNVTSVEIVDSIASDGRYSLKITADGTAYTGENAADILIASGYTVSWTMDGSPIDLGQVTTDNVYFSDSDGGWVNVSMLQGAGKKFAVTVSKDGTTAGTASKTCSYNDELKNGSFETPAHNSGASNVYITKNDGSAPYYWQTTASQAVWNGGSGWIEIGTTEEKAINSYGCSTSSGDITTPDGSQYAELNAEDAGALYQTVMTIPGETMYWGFSHRARSADGGSGNGMNAGGEDGMSMLIVPEELAEAKKLTTQSSLTKFYTELGLTYGSNDESVEYTYNEKVYTIYVCDDTAALKETSDGTLYGEWNSREGTFTVPEGQYLTRFFFMAQKTVKQTYGADRGITVGNLLDKVWFTQDIPKADDTDIQPDHQKYIKYNGDGTYDLTLNVKGAVETKTTETIEKAKVDVLFVLDTSGSMADTVSGSGNSKLTDAKTAITNLISSLSDEKNEDGLGKKIDAKYKLVTFSGSANIKTDGWVDGRALEDALPTSASGGTNYQDALVKAATAVATKSSEDAETVVIFLTDGEPQGCLMSATGDSSNYDAYKNSWNGKSYYVLDNDGSSAYVTDGTSNDTFSNINSKYEWGQNSGYSECWDIYYAGALMGAREVTCDRFYAVGFGLSDDTSNYRVSSKVNPQSAEQLLTNVANATGATTKAAHNSTDSSDLSEYFTGITADISSDVKTYKISNVTITDTLSTYAQLTENSKFTIEVKNADGEIVEPSESTEGTADTPATWTDSKKNTITATWNQNTNTVTMDFPKNYELEQGWTYSLTFQIEPTQKAINEYAKTGYPNEGDANTDALGNDTSSGKAGFYSNDGATLTYRVTTTKSTDYDNPVIQVPETVQLMITKHLSGNMYDASDKFTFTVTSTKASIANTNGDSTNATVSNNGMTATATLGKDETVILTVPVGAKIEITEDTNDEGYTASYTVNGGTTATTDNSYTIGSISGNTTVEFTNTKNVDIDSGVLLDSVPYILVLAVVIGGAAVIVVRRRKNGGD